VRFHRTSVFSWADSLRCLSLILWYTFRRHWIASEVLATFMHQRWSLFRHATACLKLLLRLVTIKSALMAVRRAWATLENNTRFDTRTQVVRRFFFLFIMFITFGLHVVRKRAWRYSCLPSCQSGMARLVTCAGTSSTCVAMVSFQRFR